MGGLPDKCESARPSIGLFDRKQLLRNDYGEFFEGRRFRRKLRRDASIGK